MLTRTIKPPANATKRHASGPVHAFLADYWTATELCRVYPQTDDILSGVLALRTAGNTSTRALSRKVLFRILRACPVITTEAVRVVTGNRYSPPTVAQYAALARVASKALEPFVATLPELTHRPRTDRQEQEALDRPHLDDLEAARATVGEFVGPPWGFINWSADPLQTVNRWRRRCGLEDLIA